MLDLVIPDLIKTKDLWLRVKPILLKDTANKDKLTLLKDMVNRDKLILPKDTVNRVIDHNKDRLLTLLNMYLNTTIPDMETDK